jgi:hypothetical protein
MVFSKFYSFRYKFQRGHSYTQEIKKVKHRIWLRPPPSHILGWILILCSFLNMALVTSNLVWLSYFWIALYSTLPLKHEFKQTNITLFPPHINGNNKNNNINKIECTFGGRAPCSPIYNISANQNHSHCSNTKWHDSTEKLLNCKNAVLIVTEIDIFTHLVGCQLLYNLFRKFILYFQMKFSCYGQKQSKYYT